MKKLFNELVALNGADKISFISIDEHRHEIRVIPFSKIPVDVIAELHSIDAEIEIYSDVVVIKNY
jgi:hypothetical protein